MRLFPALAAALGAAAMISFPSAASAKVAATQTICANTPIPSGWMPTAYFDTNLCGQPGSIYYNARTIKDVTGTASGGTVTTCINPPPPAGFYATALSYSYSCEAGKTPNGLLNNQQTLTNLNGRPSGSTAIICGIQSAPSGWTVVAVVQSYLCVYAHGGGVGDNAVSIRKL
ncbi:hypothetical protein AB0O28_01390 [Microbispora sp. NPDC088329]|uniref:hypothetical protein n=1 Tax=Microbispora sp. NPDC088329 TaxID=3154869 RepID=UPI0034334A14